MGDTVTRIQYVLDATQANAEAAKLSGNLSGIDKAAKSGAAGASVALTGIEKAAASSGAGLAVLGQSAVQADPRIQALFASLRSMKEEIIALPPTTQAATTAISKTAASTGELALGFGTLAGSMAFAIPVAINLIGVLIEMATEKEKLIKLDEEQIQVDARLQASRNTGTQFTREYARTLHDLNSVNAQLKQSGEALLVAQANESDAVKKSSTAYNELAASTTDVRTKIATYVVGLFASVKTEAEATAERREATKTLNENIDARIKLAAEMHQTVAGLIAERQAAGATREEIERLTGALNNGALAQANFSRGRDLIARLKFQASDTSELLTRTQLQERYRQGLAALTDEERKQVEQAEITTKNQKTLNDEHVRAAKVVRDYSSELINLRKRADEAEGALLGDSFTRREEKIRIDIQAERDKLAAKHRLSATALDALSRIEVAQTEKVSRDRTEAEQRVRVEIAKGTIALNENLVEKHRDLMNLEIAEKVVALHKEFGFTVQAEELIDAFKRLKYSQFNKWYLDERNKVFDLELKANEQMMAVLEAERLAFDKRMLDEAVRRARAQGAARGAASTAVLGGVDSSGVDSILLKMKQLGPEFEDVENNAKLVERAIRMVDAAFGSASLSTAQFETRIDILSGASVNLSTRLSELVDWQQILTAGIHAFTSAIAGAVAGTENLGRALLVGFLQVLAEIAIMLGTLFILAAAGFIALPGFQWSAGQLAAAGTALLVFGAVLGGLAQRFGQEKTPQSSAAAGGGAGGSTAGGGRREIENNIIPFPTSGGNSGGMTVNNFKIEGRDVGRFLKGEVISWSNESGGPLQRAKRKAS